MPVFDIPIKGSLPLFFAMTTLYTVATSGLGLFIARMRSSDRFQETEAGSKLLPGLFRVLRYSLRPEGGARGGDLRLVFFGPGD